MLQILEDSVLLFSSIIVLLAALRILSAARLGEISVRVLVALGVGVAAAGSIAMVWSQDTEPPAAHVLMMLASAAWVLQAVWRNRNKPQTPMRRETDWGELDTLPEVPK
ncbi:hypothetical protein [Eleftheria terrae]|uniref:hypothetical protein n=1 Tax=Eleftheria terrae TaxID=1597781 RepID=UPI00263A87AB|nr:hypothetical protein [Eleftheria terrae]WKB53031.1 hypothetical protein N7L95_01090 [Eleftheria terrae]